MGHSFQIRAATAMAQPGLEVSMITMSGRRNSAAFLRYIPQDAKGESSVGNCPSISETYGTVGDDGIAISLLSHVYSYS